MATFAYPSTNTSTATRTMNRFFGINGDQSTQLAPWELCKLGLPIDVARFQLEVALRFQSDIAGGIIVVPVGFISDLASVPSAVWDFLPPDDNRLALGAWFHDWLYRNHGNIVLESGVNIQLTRHQCDEIFCSEAMPDLGADKYLRVAVELALYPFGELAWDAEPSLRKNSLANFPITR